MNRPLAFGLFAALTLGVLFGMLSSDFVRTPPSLLIIGFMASLFTAICFERHGSWMLYAFGIVALAGAVWSLTYPGSAIPVGRSESGGMVVVVLMALVSYVAGPRRSVP